MSASAVGLFATNALETLISNTTQDNSKKFKQAFQQLGQDLQSGNVSQAETDLATLRSYAPSSTSASSSPSGVSKDFSQISTDLQSGNITEAQSDYATLQQDLQQNSSHVYHHHAHRYSQIQGTQTQQDLGQLGQALQSGNLNVAQQAYTALQADLSAFSASSSLGASSLPVGSSGTTGLNVSV